MSKDNSYYFICNPASNTGRMKKKWPPVLNKIEELFEKDSYDWIFTEYPLHAMKLTEQAVDNGYHNIIAVGGDGIANEIANSIISNQFNTALGLIPMGTSNDIHITYDLPFDPIDSLTVLLEDNVERLPAGQVTGDFSPNPYFFLDHADTGISALAAKSARDGLKLLKGEFKYTYHAIKQILRFKRNSGTIFVDGEERKAEFSIVATSMGETMSGYKLWPENHRQMGDLGVLIGEGHGRFGLLRLLLAAEKGNHIGRKGVEYLRGKRLEFNLDKPWPFQAEGEIVSEGSKEVQIEHIPNLIDIIMPKTKV